jgi:ABC-type nitrate/sulfonate/bicarbonate transport system substrate-binding protein
MKSKNMIWAGLYAVGMLASGPAVGAEPAKITMAIFQPPSLGAFLPPIIKAQKLDAKHGLDITFVSRSPDAYIVQFNTGEYQLGGSAAVLNVGLAETRGVDVQYLFNVFDYWAYLVTSRPNVKTLKDLEGKQIVAAKSTSSYRIFTWFAKQQGVDISRVSVINSAAPGLISYAVADRTDGVHMWSPGYDVAMTRKPTIRTLDLKIKETWKRFAGSDNIPYLGVAAHTKWVKENAAIVPKLYRVYKDAAAWTLANPEEASKLISPKGTAQSQKAIADLIRANDRLKMNVTWAGDIQKELRLIYKVGLDVDILMKQPSDKTFYTGPKS